MVKGMSTDTYSLEDRLDRIEAHLAPKPRSRNQDFVAFRYTPEVVNEFRKAASVASASFFLISVVLLVSTFIMIMHLATLGASVWAVAVVGATSVGVFFGFGMVLALLSAHDDAANEGE